jgi:hypothetical protein
MRDLYSRLIVLADAIVKERRFGEQFGGPFDALTADEKLCQLAIEARSIADNLAAAATAQAPRNERMDAVVKAIHGSPEFSFEGACKAVDKAAPTYTACGGCGATNPSQRCIGCLHPFGGGEA